MPDTDWLTGLSSRAAFARQVGQADQDREEFAVAIIGLRHIDEINRQVGFDVGDDLLRTVGRALGDRVGVGTTVARLGGARFGMMTVGVGAEGVAAWLAPVTSAVATAVAGWTFEQIDFNGDHPVEPQLVVGAAGGYSGRVWADAAIALDVCETERADGSGGGALSIYDPDDERFASLREQQTANELMLQALGQGSVPWSYRRIERWEQPNPQRPWLRIGASGMDGKVLRPAVGVCFERAMIDRAAETVAEQGGQTRITVPLRSTLTSDRAVDHWLGPSIERLNVPATRLVFEVGEPTVTDGGPRARRMLAEIADLGADLVLAECSGGTRTISVLEDLPIRYLKPATELIEQLTSGVSTAELVMATISQLAVAVGGDVIMPCDVVLPRSNLAPGFRELAEESSIR